MLSLHGSIHVGQLNLATEIHINGGAFDGGISEVLHRISQLEKQLKSMMCKETIFSPPSCMGLHGNALPPILEIYIVKRPLVANFYVILAPLPLNSIKLHEVLTLGSLMPVRLVCGLSKTRKAAKLAVYDATMIMANPAQTMPRTRAEKDRGVPSPIPALRRTPQANQMALVRLSDSSRWARATEESG